MQRTPPSSPRYLNGQSTSDRPRTFRSNHCDDPEIFRMEQSLRSDGELLDYMNNLFEMWRRYEDRPTHVVRKTCQWRCEVLKHILNGRGVTTPDLYDEIFGYQPIKKRRVTIDGLQEEVRAAEQALKEAKARARAHVSALACQDTNDQTYVDQHEATPPPHDEEFEEETLSGGEEV